MTYAALSLSLYIYIHTYVGVLAWSMNNRHRVSEKTCMKTMSNQNAIRTHWRIHTHIEMANSWHMCDFREVKSPRRRWFQFIGASTRWPNYRGKGEEQIEQRQEMPDQQEQRFRAKKT